MLDFRVDTFLEVCRLMNYTRAAEQLNLTQPAVSQHIRWLEEQCGVKLFHYENKQLNLTAAGQMLRSAAITMKQDQMFLYRRMQEADSEDADLCFGVTPTVGMYLIPKPLAAYRRQHPSAKVSMQVENSELLCRWLDSGEIDFAILEGYFHKEDYDSMLYRTERYLAVCAKDYPFQNTPHQLADLLGETLLVREEGSGNREIIRRSLSRKNLALQDFHSLFEVGDMNVLKQMLVQGCGIGFLYEAAVQEDLQQGRLRIIELEDFAEDHDITFLWRKGEHLCTALPAHLWRTVPKRADFLKQGRKKGRYPQDTFPCILYLGRDYIMPPMPAPGAPAIASFSSLLSATRDSVVSTMEATEEAFCRAERVTLVGSTIPAGIMST